jgi:hypothetical protein
MKTATLHSTRRTAQQRRLRAMVQQLVIELGYLERCLEGGQDSTLQSAAAGLDSAIDSLNAHLAG